MSSPAAARGQEVRQRLLAAAAELIAERGWSAVSTRILAERAGVTPSVVHYHFPSVRAVLTESAVTAMREVLVATQGVFAEGVSPRDVVDAMIASIERYDGTDPMSQLFTETYLAATRDEQLRAQLEALVADFKVRVTDWLTIYQVAEPEATALVLAAAIDGLALHRGLGSTSTGIGTVLRRLVS
jgi:AcrR family transcriptional regulator